MKMDLKWKILHEEIARYAAETAGTSDDLDERLEATGNENVMGKHFDEIPELELVKL